MSFGIILGLNIERNHKIFFQSVNLHVLLVQFKMNNQSEWERVVQWSHSESTYLLKVSSNPEQLYFQLQNKNNGDLWNGLFSKSRIEQLTQKARNRKSYSIFSSMLRTALDRTKEYLFIEILSYREICLKTMRNGVTSNHSNPEKDGKRFIILNYHLDFEKISFPLPLVPYQNAPPDRLRFTIRRMAQELLSFREERSENQIQKENAFLKYEIQALKAKSSNKNQGSMIFVNRTDDLQKQIKEKSLLVQKLNARITELQKAILEKDDKLKSNQQTIKTYEKQIQHLKTKNQKVTDRQYAQKIEMLIKKMQKLGQQLIFARQKEKKSQIKINTLEKQLQNMQKNNQSRNTYRYQVSQLSPKTQSQKSLSVRSGNSNRSGKSKGSKNLKNTNSQFKNTIRNNNQNNNKKLSNKKSSVYDSDTQSSKMRRMNIGRSSPYRQATSTITNNKNKSKVHQERSRSKSREKMVSPKITESQMYSEAYQSDDSQERFERIQRQIKQKPSKTKKVLMKNSSAQQTQVDSRVQTLQQMIRKAAQSTKKRAQNN